MQSRNVLVLDVQTESGSRRLLETVGGTGMTAAEVDSLDAFNAGLAARHARVGVVAFEALWPDPQKSLRTLRDTAAGTRINVVYNDRSRPLRLRQRSWCG